MKAVTAEQYNDMVQGAQRYSQADKSDPFAFRRAMTHIKNGIAGFFFDNNGNRHDAFYNAEEGKEERTLPKGQAFSDGSNKYSVTTYRNMVRP